jgi:hypothetical protein
MTNPSTQDLSPLAQVLLQEEDQPTFSLPNRISVSDSPAFKVSLDANSNYSQAFDPVEAGRLRKRNEPIFPPTFETEIIPSRPLGPYSAEPWPISFPEDEWEQIWNGEPFQIDTFLRRAKHDDPLPIVIREDQFKGAPWRLTIDPPHNVTKRLPIFRHGMVISYRNSNRLQRRYIVDHCAFQDDSTAYLRVVCYVSRRKVLGTNTTHPPFILAVPKELCNVRIHPDFEFPPIRLSTPEPSFTSLPPGLPSYFSAHQEETVGWREKLLQLMFFWRT